MSIKQDIKDFYRYGFWYQRCKNAIQEKYGDDWKLFAKLLAATSPRQSVKRNVSLAKRAYKSYKTFDHDFAGFLPASIGNVKRAYENAELSGPKVSAFYENITGNLDVVTVDIWMFRYYNLKPSAKNYKIIERRVKRSAKRYGLKPAVLQAILWTACRWRAGFKPVAFHYFIANEQLEFDFFGD